jgi:hypothetical protein
VSAIYDWWADPRGELAATVHHELGRLQEAIVEGDNGLRAQLERLAEARATQRRQAVWLLLEGGQR